MKSVSWKYSLPIGIVLLVASYIIGGIIGGAIGLIGTILFLFGLVDGITAFIKSRKPVSKP